MFPFEKRLIENYFDQHFKSWQGLFLRVAIYHGTVAVCPWVGKTIQPKFCGHLDSSSFFQADFPIDKILTQEDNSDKELLQKSRIVKFDIQVCKIGFQNCKK